MMRWIVGSSLKFRFLVIAVAVAMMYFGILQVQRMPVDVFPEFAPPLVEVQTICLGLTAVEVESLVTVPMEQSLAGLPGLDVLRSKSVSQLSSVKMLFKRGTDLLRARQMVEERIAMVTPSMPKWAAPPVVLPPLSSTSRMMKIGISSKTRSVMDLSMITYWTIRQRLLRVPGVANVAIWGERLQMLNVNVVPDLLQKHRVTLDEVMTVTADALDSGMFTFSQGHHIGTGGWIDTPNQRLQVRHVAPLVYKYDEVRPDPLANVPLAVRDGKQLLLKDVARVVVDHQPMVGDAIINDGPGLLLIVEKFPWANTLRDAGRRSSARYATARSSRRGDRLDDLPAGDLYRDVTPQPHHGDAHRGHSLYSGARRLPVRVAGRDDQHRGDAVVSGRCRARPLLAWRDH